MPVKEQEVIVGAWIVLHSNMMGRILFGRISRIESGRSSSILIEISAIPICVHPCSGLLIKLPHTLARIVLGKSH